MEQGWILIFTADNLTQAELYKTLLNEHEILAVMINKQSSAHLIGEVELYVKDTDVIRAKLLISKYEAN